MNTNLEVEIQKRQTHSALNLHWQKWLSAGPRGQLDCLGQLYLLLGEGGTIVGDNVSRLTKARIAADSAEMRTTLWQGRYSCVILEPPGVGELYFTTFISRDA